MQKAGLGTTLRKALNIREDEGWYVQSLFLHHFFQGIGIAVFFTIANALFLSEYSIKTLPIVYMISAVVLLIAGRIYASAEHRLHMNQLLQGVMIFIFISVFTIWLGLFWLPIAAMAFLLMIWHRVLYLLGNLEFWGLSAVLFDIRQSKRLFNLISAGDVPAKLMGYLSVSALIQFMSLEHLLIVAALSFIVSLYFLNKILYSSPMKALMAGDKEHHHFENDHHNKRDNIVFKIFKSNFIFILALLAFTVIVGYTIIDFAFYSEVKNAFQTEKELAYFLGLFFSVGKGFTIISKVFFSGRIISEFGIKRSMLIMPISLLIVATTVFITQFLSVTNTTLFWFFGIMMLVAETLRYTLHNSLFLVLFQPLNRHLRLHGHTTVKGVMEPIGLGIAGLALFLLIEIFDRVNLVVVNNLLIIILLCWIGVVVLVNKKFLQLLQDAIRKRMISGSEISIQDKRTYDIIKKKLKSPHPEEVIYALELAEKFKEEELEKHLLPLLFHESDAVKLHVLRKIESNQLENTLDKILPLIEIDPSPAVRAEAIKVYSHLHPELEQHIIDYLDGEEPLMKKGAITGLIKKGDIESVVTGGQHLLEMINSEDPAQRASGATIIGELDVRSFYKPLEKLLRDRDPNVKMAALHAAGKIRSRHLLPYVFKVIKESNYSREAQNAIINFEEAALDYMIQNLGSLQSYPISEKIRFCQIAARIGLPKGQKIAKAFVWNKSLRVRRDALQALRLLDFRVDGRDAIPFKKLIREEISHAYWCFYSIEKLKKRKSLFPLADVLMTEVNDCKIRLLDLYSFFHSRELLMKIREGIFSTHKEKHANAMEMLDELTDNKEFHQLMPIFDRMTNEERLQSITRQQLVAVETIEQIILNILKKGVEAFHRYTVATALLTLDYKKVWPVALDKFIIPYLRNDSKILSEAAYKIIQHRIEVHYSTSLKFVQQHIVKSEQADIMEILNQEQEGLLEIEKVVVLKGTTIFAETPENMLVDIASIVREERVGNGQTIFEKGDYGKCMYIIYEGAVQIHDAGHVFAELKNHDFFGELALLDPEPRSAAATSTDDTLLLRLDQDAFYELMTDRPEVLRGIMRILVQRLRNQNDQLTALKARIN